MAAGEGRRLRPITERWPKPILPIDGRPVVVTLVHELAAAGCGPIVVVTGHLAEQVEALLEPLPTTCGSSASRRGSARPTRSPARRRRRRTWSPPPTRSTPPGDLARFAAEGRQADGAIAVHGDFRPPLWLLGARVARYLDPLPGAPPYELAHVFRDAVEAGAQVSAIQVGRTRDLTSPVDLVRENFPYLR